MHDDPATTAATEQPPLPVTTTAPADLQVLSERMKGLEPSTFCMASASDVRTRSRPFAQSAWLPGLDSGERTQPNPSERQTLPFLPRSGGTGTPRRRGSAACVDECQQGAERV